MPATITTANIQSSVGRTLEQTISPGQNTDWVKLAGEITLAVEGTYDPVEAATGDHQVRLRVQRSARDPAISASPTMAMAEQFVGRGISSMITRESGVAWYRVAYSAGAGDPETVFLTGKVA